MIVFENEGNLDSRLITTMGVNVKTNESPIGTFGTGLKYAIAASLRLGIHIEIQSNGRIYNFFKKPETIRGKSFDFIEMKVRNGIYEDIPVSHVPLSYTTEMGKKWEPWMIYRELLSNMLDESGRVYRPSGVIEQARDGTTKILVEGLDAIFDAPENWFLGENRIPFAETPICQIFARKSDCIFYKGIRVLDLERESEFTYNITGHIDLTEDRTARYSFEVDSIIRRAITSLTDRDAIKSILRCSGESFEGKIDYTNAIYIAANPSQEFIQTVVEMTREDSTERVYINDSARDLAQTHAQSVFLPAPRPPTEAETHALNDAEVILAKIGITVTGVRIIDNHKGTGLVSDGAIWLTPHAFTAALPRILFRLHMELMGLDDVDRERWLTDRLLEMAGYRPEDFKTPDTAEEPPTPIPDIDPGYPSDDEIPF